MKSSALNLLLALAALATACADGSAPAVPSPGAIGRIVSLSPSITREIMELGCGDRIVGVTTFSPVPGPETVIVGSLIRPNAEAIALLRPDIILASSEDSAVQYTERLVSLGIPLHVFKRNDDFDDLCDNYAVLAKLLGKEKEAEAKLARYRERRALLLAGEGNAKKGIRVAFIVSADPLIAVSDRSFIGRIITDAGGLNCYAGVDIPYPVVSLESLAERRPDVIILMSGEMRSRIKKALAPKDPPMHIMPPDHVAHYTPADYVASMELIGTFLKGGVR